MATAPTASTRLAARLLVCTLLSLALSAPACSAGTGGADGSQDAAADVSPDTTDVEPESDDGGSGHADSSDPSDVAPFEVGPADGIADAHGPDTHAPDTHGAGMHHDGMPCTGCHGPEVVEDPNAPKPVLTADGPCQAPVIIPEDSLSVVETAHSLQFPATTKETWPIVSHIMDIELDPESGLSFAVGLPGLFVFGHTDEGELRHIGEYPPGAATGATSWAVDGAPAHGDVAEYNNAEALGNDLVALTARGNPAPEFMFGPGHPPIAGLFILDVSEPSAPQLVSELDIADASSLAWAPPLLYVGSYVGDLWVVDLADPAGPQIVGHLDGELQSPWSMKIAGDVGWIADNALGLVALDLTLPTQPAMIGNTWTASGAQDLVLGDGYIYVAAGGAGIETFDIGDIESPVSTGVVDVGPSALSLDIGDGGEGADVLWVVNQESVTVLTLEEPGAPVQIAVQETPYWALGVVAGEGLTAHVADWCAVHTVAFDPSIKSPEADMHPEELFFWDGADRKTFEVRNRGDSLLSILGAVPDDERVTVMWDSLVVPPGGTATGFAFVDQTQLGEGEEPLQAQVCVATNDPDSPTQTLTVAATSPYTDVTWGALNDDQPTASSVTIGQPAPDFVLPDLGGAPHTLSNHLGQPVLLIFFSTW